MELKYKVQITEGLIFDTLKSSIQDFIADLPSNAKPKITGKLCKSISFTIYRNGKPVTDKDVEPYRDTPAKDVVYSAALFRGGKQIASITPCARRKRTTSSFAVQRICRLPNGWNAR